jgi:excisionase family DNA binding protein
MPQPLLTLAEATKILKVSKTKLYHERSAGRLHVVTIGVRFVRISEAEIIQYIRAAREPRRPPDGAGADRTEVVA